MNLQRLLISLTVLNLGLLLFLLGVLVLLISVVLYWVRRNVEDKRAPAGAKA